MQGLAERTGSSVRDQVVAPLPEARLVEMTIPDSHGGRSNKYRPRDAERVALASAIKA